MQYNDSSNLSPRPARRTSRSFSIVQHNSLGSWDVFLSVKNSFGQLTSPPMIVALQDPLSGEAISPPSLHTSVSTPHPPGQGWLSTSTPTC